MTNTVLWRRGLPVVVALALLVPFALSGSDDPPREPAEVPAAAEAAADPVVPEGRSPRPAPAAANPALARPAVRPSPSAEMLAAMARLRPLFAVFGVGYGGSIDPEDVRALAVRLGVGVGDVVDAADVARVATAAEDHPFVRFPVFATVGGVDLRLPSERVELVGFHESNHDGARDLTPVGSAVRMLTLPTRERGTLPRTAADVVTAPGVEIRAPVTGRVLRAGTYVLYCEYSDDYMVVEPDAHPGWEVKILHIDRVRVRAGDRVEAGRTVVARGPTPLPFASQVDDFTAARNWPHVHIEVVDPSIPDRPSPGGGC